MSGAQGFSGDCGPWHFSRSSARPHPFLHTRARVPADVTDQLSRRWPGDPRDSRCRELRCWVRVASVSGSGAISVRPSGLRSLHGVPPRTAPCQVPTRNVRSHSLRPSGPPGTPGPPSAPRILSRPSSPEAAGLRRSLPSAVTASVRLSPLGEGIGPVQ